MRAIMLVFRLLSLVGTASCASSLAQSDIARDTVYDVGFPVMWAALRSAVAERYRIAYEDESSRLIVSCWVNEGVASGTRDDPTVTMTRLGARLNGGPAWSVEVVSLRVYVRSGNASRPGRYMPYRENRVYVAVQDRLRGRPHSMGAPPPEDSSLLMLAASAPNGSCPPSFH